MKRYQIYLNPGTVAMIDKMEKATTISRSQLIREGLDKAISEYISLIVDLFSQSKRKPNYSVLDKMSGFIKSKGGKKTNYSDMVDEIVYAEENL
ncbi:hypothetical protein A2767_02940 [Candidatus Roizmanbacteria bacterium RIFCSPHIGHO2_01_FULL_35_10]|uniref:Ribbon-helix-helix protein CopG domain-containing protein n=1 Tax=Candidatus Roizmanbacteria bacterium RIFCSPLOWO2_01_FULL_35_13 TaxID=1802055 RepID=A0A1F7ICM5_9BACT|nr:MAG: hypothetical protein A2767_02940 [Candidatus Roizmanbacteria bacterium RIFCSPHIGHO2_01_FULL_35_10]OGK41109.1 MAG: hypothetical protein A3A74_02075 [Candidatus Roizmanbacteria bacterium RIFCSPLOWO2_01_FULL_35_13]